MIKFEHSVFALPFALTAALLAICTYFLVSSLATLNDLVDKVSELNTRVSILEYANGKR